MQSNRWLQTLIVLLVIIASAWLAGQVWTFLMQFSSILLLFFLAWLLAFVLSPIARALQRRGVPKTLAVGIVYLVLAVLAVLAVWWLVPPITAQVGQLQTGIQNGSYMATFNTFYEDVVRTLRGLGLENADLDQIYNEITAQAQNVLLNIVSNTFNMLQGVATFALQFILVLILSFYFMNDSDRLFSGIVELLPTRWQDEARLVGMSIEKSFGGFIRGQLVFALVYAIFTAIIMIMPPFQLDFVIIASIVAGLCMIIPLVGNFLAFLPAIMVALVTGRTDIWLWLLLVEFIMQSFMMNVLGPRIMSSAIGIHPLYVVAAMLVGGQVAGLWGALFGIPIAGAINLIGRPVMRRIRYQTNLYKDPEMPTLPTSAFLTGPLALSMVQMQTNPTVRPPGAPAEQGSDEVLMGAAQALSAPPSGPSVPPAGGVPVSANPRISGPLTPGMATQRTSIDPQTTGGLGRTNTLSQPAPDVEDLYMVPRTPTFSMRVWRFIFSVAGKARTWAGKRAEARLHRQ
ncbi:MAG: AI-2E family transporter [Chloroflexota bacterium]|nr:AI-2E family transporter [Chloroflexota bacterium]